MASGLHYTGNVNADNASCCAVNTGTYFHSHGAGAAPVMDFKEKLHL